MHCSARGGEGVDFLAKKKAPEFSLIGVLER